MSIRICISKRVIPGIRVSIPILGIILIGHNRIRLNPAAQRRVVEACVVKVQAGFGFALAARPRSSGARPRFLGVMEVCGGGAFIIARFTIRLIAHFGHFVAGGIGGNVGSPHPSFGGRMVTQQIKQGVILAHGHPHRAGIVIAPKL